MNRRLLVVARHAHDTGENQALLEVVGHLVAAPDGPAVSVLLQRGGPLADRFAALAPTRVVDDLAALSPLGVAERGLGRIGLGARALAVRGRRVGLDDWGAGDAVYLHTVLCAQVLRYLRSLQVTVLCRVPEAVLPLHHPLSRGDIDLLVDRVDRFLPVTDAGVDELCGPLGVPAGSVVRLPEAVVTDEASVQTSSAARAALRRSLGLTPDDSVVIGSFGASAADPPSPAPSLAVALRRHDREATMLCVAPQHASDGWARHDVECAGLVDRVTVVAAEDPLPPYAEVVDIVVHAGWGPDHPLPYLEAMARGVPAVCFEGHDLAALVGADEAGFVCPYLDLDTMAERVATLVADPEQRRTRGAVAARRVREHHDAGAVAARLLAELGEARP